MNKFAVSAVLAALIGCGGTSSTVVSTPDPVAPTTASAPSVTGAAALALAPAPEGLRLPSTARPLAYRLALEVDPAQESFRGRVVIDVELDVDAHPLWLNAENLTIASARLLAADGSTARELRAVPGREPVIGLAGDAPIAAGRHQIEIEYSGVQNDQQSDGVLRRNDAGSWYAVTDLEPLGARRVLPCFDEPSFKVPWQLELTTSASLVAASNTPVERDEPLPDGKHRIRFAPTPPMPSYLFAFAVGPYDVVDAGKTRKGVPMRILVPRGRGAEAAFMAKQSGRIVAALEDYTGIDFPYAKVDHVVIPGGYGGAMENVGLITYAPLYLLLPDSASADSRDNALRYMAHELAHQWFGNLVTLAWWDDLWLNEAFATWASHHVMRDLYSDYGGDLSAARSRFVALSGEETPTVRAVRQPVVEKVDIGRAFDGITYEKGATVLHMIEDLLGDDAMKRAVHAYLERHRWGNARAADFIAALSTASGRDMTPLLAPWLDQPGAPLIAMSLECAPGKPATVELSQRRMPVVGLDATKVGETVWHVPVCARVPGEKTPRCAELSGLRGQITLGDKCPALVVPTGRGHYRTEVSPELRAALVRSFTRLERAEQAALVTDTSALVDAQILEVGAMIDLLPGIGAASNSIAINTAAGAIQRYDEALADDVRPAFRKRVATAMGRLARATGWVARAGEPLHAAAARRNLVPVVVVHAGDTRLRKEALALAARWLTDHDVVPRDRWGTVLRTAIAVDDGVLFERMMKSVTTDPDLLARTVMASALGHTRDPRRLRQALELLVAEESTRPELRFVLYGPDSDALEAVRLAFLEERAGDVLTRLPADWRESIAPSTCASEHRARVAALLDAHFVALSEFGENERNRYLAASDACIATRANLSRGLAEYFKTARR